MRWTSKDSPNVGDTRIKFIFPLIPRYINGVWYWLELIKVKQKYCENIPKDVSDIILYGIHYWLDIEVIK